MNGKFDLVTHQRHPKSGRVIAENHYTRHVKQIEGGGVKVVYERPQKSGLFYYENGEIDKELSQEGLARIEKEAAERKKTELQKAKEAYELSQKRLKAAQEEFEAEEKAKHQASFQKKGH